MYPDCPLDGVGKIPHNIGMAKITPITAEAVRATLIARATAFCAAHNYSLSRLGDEALKDSKFLSRVQAGDNFTIKTYQRVIDWIDERERELASAA
jgi:hypothetical protein